MFDFVADAERELLTSATVTQPLRATSAARQFYPNFYAQFFENVLHAAIESVTTTSAQQANVLAKTRDDSRLPNAR